MQYASDLETSNQADAQPQDSPLIRTVSADELDVLEFIGGAALRKMKNVYTKKDRSLHQLELLCESSPPVRATPSLIQTKSRGGLITPFKSFVELLAQRYATDCRADFTTLDGYSDCVNSAIKELLNDCMRYFKKVISHHRCYRYLVQQKIKKKKVGKGKSLRAKLVDKSTL
jgi:hypothetical protein